MLSNLLGNGGGHLIFIKRSDCADSGESQFACGKGGGGDANDMLIAAHARALDAVCVTDNPPSSNASRRSRSRTG